MSFLTQYSPLRHLPPYSGPYTVGSCDVEVPVSELDSPAETPDPSIGTVSYRIFYPCEATESSRPVRWVPSPQSRYGSAYCRFLGASPRVADFMALFPQFLYMTKIPVKRNCNLTPPATSSGRWPVVVFSHGLGGSRNAYSHICGSLASYGVVVVAADHRDSSAPISFIRATATTPAKTVPYNKYSHTPSPEVYQGRDRQLRTRLWELGCIHDAIVKMDLGTCPQNLDPNLTTKGKPTEVLSMFKGKMDVHRPGAIVWAGHSFGACTTIQFLKSIYYGVPSEEERGEFGETLFRADPESHLTKQITTSSVSLLLDTWCLPLRSRSTRWLWNKPLPCYDVSAPMGPAGGSAILAVESEAFFIWEGNMNDTKRSISPSTPAPNKSIQWSPYLFYPEKSAHLSQSDFGILFPWITSKVLKTQEPIRLLQLNTRAMLQAMRVNGFEVAPPQPSDLEIDPEETKNKLKTATNSEETLTEKSPVLDDAKILDFGKSVRGWIHVPIEPYKDKGSDDDSDMHVEEDYRTPAPELDEAEVLGHQTPKTEKDEAEVLGLTKAATNKSEHQQAKVQQDVPVS